MATFKEISSADITTSRSFLNQLVDVIQEDISGSTTRQSYQVFVTGSSDTASVAPGVTSSLFQTVYDQDFTLQTANPVFDMTVGMNREYVMTEAGPLDTGTGLRTPLHQSEDDAGKLSFASNTLMVREKINVYRQFSQLLLNDADGKFAAPYGDTAAANGIDNAFFVCYKRLFARDAIKRETYAMKFYSEAVYIGVEETGADISYDDSSGDVLDPWAHSDGPMLHGVYTYASPGTDTDPEDGVYDATATTPNETSGTENTNGLSYNAAEIFTDIGSSTSQQTSPGGAVGNIVMASDTTKSVGLMFYDHGIAVYDLSKILMGDQRVSGSIDAVTAEEVDGALLTGRTLFSDDDSTTLLDLTDLHDGKTVIGAKRFDGTDSGTGGYHGALLSNPDATFIPDLMVSGSIDNILNHISQCRFGDGSDSAMTFQNVTNINSTLIFCRATADEFNYSSNPTFTDAENRIVVIDEGSENTQRAFSFITSVGLYDANNSLLAVAKLSRPIEKNDEKDLTMRVRLDF
jgi:hypothetical protein